MLVAKGSPPLPLPFPGANVVDVVDGVEDIGGAVITHTAHVLLMVVVVIVSTRMVLLLLLLFRCSADVIVIGGVVVGCVVYINSAGGKISLVVVVVVVVEVVMLVSSCNFEGRSVVSFGFLKSCDGGRASATSCS